MPDYFCGSAYIRSFVRLITQSNVPNELDCGEVASAINGHLVTLHNELDWFDPSLLRALYAPLRLHLDTQRAEREAKYQEYWRSRIGKRVTLTPAKSIFGLIAGDSISGTITEEISDKAMC
jgi:hypothetical protein